MVVLVSFSLNRRKEQRPIVGVALLLALFAIVLSSLSLVGPQRAAAAGSCGPYCEGISNDPVKLAQQLVAYHDSGKFHASVAGNGSDDLYRAEIIPIANGAATPTCNIDVRVLQTMVIVVKRFSTLSMNDLNRECNTIRHDPNCTGSTSLHCADPSRAMDFGNVGGARVDGLNSRSHELLDFLDTFMPAGTHALQDVCSGNNFQRGWTFTNMSGIPGIKDACNHQHVDFSGVKASLRLATVSTEVHLAKPVAVSENGQGKTEIFSTANNGLVYSNWWTASGWSGWLPTSSAPGTGIALETPNVVQNDGGYEEQFAAGSNGNVYHNWQSASGWSGWVPVTSQPSGVTLSGAVTSRNKQGAQEVFASGSDGRVWHAWWSSTGWQGWIPVTDNPSSLKIGSFTIALNDGGYQELSGVGSNGVIYHNWAGANGWSGWVPIAASPSGVSFKSVTVSRNDQNKQELFAAANNGLVYHAWDGATGWSGWIPVTNNPSNSVAFRDLTATKNDVGAQELFAAGSDGTIYHNWMSSSGWSGWIPVVATPADVSFSTIAAGKNDSGNTELFAASNNGLVYNAWWSSTGWQGWIPVSSNPTGVRLDY